MYVRSDVLVVNVFTGGSVAYLKSTLIVSQLLARDVFVGCVAYFYSHHDTSDS